jgi:Ca2+-binding EF-hand superfamily protein
MSEFFRAMRGELSARRLALVDLAFQRIDKRGRGKVTLAEMAQLYDASRHPDVVSGKSSQSSVMREFLRVWDKNGDDLVTQEEFRDYFAVSCNLHFPLLAFLNL